MADIVTPERPAWCLEEGEGLDGNEEVGQGKGKGSKGKRKLGGRMEIQNEVS